MPLDIHVKKFQHVPDIGEDRYATDPEKASETGQGNFTTAQNNFLGRFGQGSMMRYKDIDAYFCKDCRYVFGVTCPKCGIKSAPLHGFDTSETIFEVRGADDYDRKEGMVWVITVCRKCSFSFRVLVRP
jgi:hypothetical protein